MITLANYQKSDYQPLNVIELYCYCRMYRFVTTVYDRQQYCHFNDKTFIVSSRLVHSITHRQ